MKRKDLDELEGRQIDKSLNLRQVASYAANKVNDEMNDSLKAVVEKLSPYLQERAKMLWEELVRLNVNHGIANRLMGMGHMGALNDPIWKYIYKLHTETRMSRIRNKGSWLLKCLLNDKLKQKV